jgi:ribosomal protein S14
MPKKPSSCTTCGKSTGDYRSIFCRICYLKAKTIRKGNPKALKGTLEYLEYRKSNNESRMKSRLKYKYNFPYEDYIKMLDNQESRCAICGTHQDNLNKRLNLDHDHNCCPSESSCGNCIRGLLCSVCNSAIGLLKDSEEIIEMALNYVKTNRKVKS